MSDTIEAAGAFATAGLAAQALDHPSAHGGGHPANCANCGAGLTGAFCAQCGQRAHLHRSIGDVFHEFLHGITHFDGKTWKTLPMLLFRPGQLIRSYIEGQRARYVAPVPLFLMVIFLMFFVLSFVSLQDSVGPVEVDASGVARGQAEVAKSLADIDRELAAARAAGNADKVRELESARAVIGTVGQGAISLAEASSKITVTDKLADEIEESARAGRLKINTGIPELDAKGSKALKNPRLVLYKLQSKAYKLSFLLVPMSLPWIWLVFLWRRGIGMYDHAIFTLYSISFMSLMFIVGSLALTADIVSSAFWVPFLLAPGAHLFVSLRGSYGLGVFSAGWRTLYLTMAAIFTLTFYCMLLVILGVFD